MSDEEMADQAFIDHLNDLELADGDVEPQNSADNEGEESRELIENFE